MTAQVVSIERLENSIAAELERLEAANWSANPVVMTLRLRALVEISSTLTTEQLLDLAEAVDARRDLATAIS
jgi:hypothetical protein